MNQMRWVFAFLIMILGISAEAASTKATLPKGIWHPMFRMGWISEITTRYDNSGSLWSIGRLNQAFTGESLNKFSPNEFGRFGRLLQQTYPNSNLVNQMSLGNIEFEADAVAQFSAPVIGYGLTDTFTLGIGIPFIKMQANIETYQTGVNNSALICNQITTQYGELSPELAEGCNRMMNADLIEEYKKALRSKGYVIPESKTYSVVGDLMLVGIYEFSRNKRFTFWEMTTVNLPTGPEDNPDDFMDMPMFHQTWTKFDFHGDYRPYKNLTLGANAAYTWKAPDMIDKRVPSYEGDELPDASRRERVRRDLGDAISLGSYSNFWFTKYFNIGAGYEYTYKGEDSFNGDRGYNYSLLSRNTESQSHRISGILTFSTIDLFFDKEFPAPFIVNYTYSDIISGTNIDRQLLHEVAFRMFF